MPKSALEIVKSLEAAKNDLGKYIRDAVIFPRARELFGKCLENFPKMDFECADEKLVSASGILIADINYGGVSLKSCYNDEACRALDHTKEKDACSLVFCPRGLFLHRSKEYFSENLIIDPLMEAPIDYYVDFAAAILLAMEEECRRQSS